MSRFDAPGNELDFLRYAGLTLADSSAILSRLLSRGVDWADLFFQSTSQESWLLEEGLVKEADASINEGVGLSAVCGEKRALAYGDELELAALRHAADWAAAVGRQGQSGRMPVLRRSTHIRRYEALDPRTSLSAEEKVALLQEIDRLARGMDERVKDVRIALAAQHERILVVNSTGLVAQDERPLCRLTITVQVEHDGRRERASAGGGGRFGYERLILAGSPRHWAQEAVQRALHNLEAAEAPGGTMTVVLGPGWPGVLLHEAVGHGLEGDFNRKGISAFSGRLGEMVAAPSCTVVDDGTLGERRGSLSIDDEGHPSQQTVLIENGRLCGYMQDAMNARLMGMQPTGNGRRSSYAAAVLPRMTNTYLLPGPHSPEEIIASVSRGLYASHLAGGQVDITSGRFVFTTAQAWLIENGRLTRPVKGATLIGHGTKVLQRITMVGNDLRLDSGIGVCVKEGQRLAVGVGQPTVRIDGITVGGTAL